jgi:hypothetical protein
VTATWTLSSLGTWNCLAMDVGAGRDARCAMVKAMESVPQAVADAATGRRAQCRRVVMAQKGQSLSWSRVVFGEENG